MKSNSSNQFWDEHRWETHINEAEQKSEEIRHFLDKTFGNEGPRWIKILQESESEHDALDTYIEEELLLDEAYLPDDDDDWDLDDFDDDDDDFFAKYMDQFSHDENLTDVPHEGINADETSPKAESEDADDSDPFGFPLNQADDELDDTLGEVDDFDDMDEGDEWKLLSNDYTMSDFGSLENLDVYNRAHDFGAHMLVRSAHLSFESPEDQQLYNSFIADVLQVSAKIASGYALGFYDDMIGGNIAFCKKALQAANRALSSLQTIKEKNLVFGDVEYRQLHCDLFEIRNDLGIYIQELRDMFESYSDIPPF
ncbi:hypothetical protein CYPRO_0330 [Cyclonatronum proteinivorum]|uniref:Uncharacterized protein n=1 Tax=Cyclonatronum proteinivorum TaxID=1457365 RepID=A0A345UGL6_9BACT|nr:hypothetical protein [Cyclonatronum proteinivorum]AXI99617.1 hypothetical protein CYPRO_0330 [Cyclonatronum proteinivorum]